SVQPAALQSGTAVTIDWNDSNTGDGFAAGWSDYVTVVNTRTGQTLFATPVAYTGAALAGGAAVPQEVKFTIPDRLAGVGTLHVTVITDSGNAVHEYNSGNTGESNNTATLDRNSTLAPYADLQVTGLSVTPDSGITSGTTLTLNWNDSNTGNAPASGWS